MNHDSLDQLAIKVVAGDREALAEFFSRNERSLLAHVRIDPIFQSALDAEEICQDTLLDFLESPPAVDPPSAQALLNLVLRAVKNNAVDAVRILNAAKRPDRGRQLEDGGTVDAEGDFLDRLLAVTTTPSLVFERNERAARVRKAIDALPARYGRTLRACYFDGKSIQEIAAEEGIKIGSVQVRLDRAKRRLVKLLGRKSEYLTR
ncbi:MAG: RNA polymerase sigma factor [Phycisphaerales bacterium]|nr:RNA polymerase sigma factor [Phycisphaerales bacterium]